MNVSEALVSPLDKGTHWEENNKVKMKEVDIARER